MQYTTTLITQHTAVQNAASHSRDHINSTAFELTYSNCGRIHQAAPLGNCRRSSARSSSRTSATSPSATSASSASSATVRRFIKPPSAGKNNPPLSGLRPQQLRIGGYIYKYQICHPKFQIHLLNYQIHHPEYQTHLLNYQFPNTQSQIPKQYRSKGLVSQARTL